MTYRNAPVDKSSIKRSSGPTTENFTNYNTTFNVNHIDINDGADPGKHFKIDLPNTGLLHVPVGDDISLFTSGAEANSGLAGLFLAFTYAANFNLITEGLPTGTKVAGADTLPDWGWYRDPSGSLIKWGVERKRNLPLGSLYLLDFRKAGNIPPFATVPFVILLTTEDTGTFEPVGLVSGSTTATSFSVRTSSDGINGNVLIQYVAIGT